MKKITFICSLLITAFLMTGCSRDDAGDRKYGKPKDIGVIVVDDASVRLEPFLYAARVAVLTTGDNVEVLDHSKEQSRIAGKIDYWYRVRLRDGIVGWIYGQNMKIFSEGSDSSVASFAKELREEENAKASKELRGKWWSVAGIGEDTFTDHILALRENGTYASLKKGSTTPVEGEYSIDSLKGEITFDKGTSFGDKANFVIRGEIYLLETTIDGKNVKFKRISTNPDFKDELMLPKEEEKPAEGAEPTAPQPE